MSLNNLATAYWLLGKYQLSVPIFEEVVQISKTNFGADHPLTIRSMSSLAEACKATGKFDLALPLFQELLATGRKNFPEDSPQLIGILGSIGLIRVAQRQWVDAEAILKDTLAICEKSHVDDWRVFSLKSALGRALFGQEKLTDAHPLLVAGYEGMKEREAAIPQHLKICLPETLDWLIELCTAADKAGERSKWEEERKQYLTGDVNSTDK
jgi:hypothetical protein